MERLMKQLVIVCFTLTTLTSCVKYLAMIQGKYREPKVENESSIISYAKQNGARYDVLYVVKSVKDYNDLQKTYPAVPAVKIYSKDKKMLAALAGQVPLESRKYDFSCRYYEGSYLHERSNL